MRKGVEDWSRFATPLGFIRLVLLVDWDPIGIFGEVRAMDEYDRYAVEVYDLLCQDTPHHKIADYLRTVEKERMKIRGETDVDVVARKLELAYQISTEK